VNFGTAKDIELDHMRVDGSWAVIQTKILPHAGCLAKALQLKSHVLTESVSFACNRGSHVQIAARNSSPAKALLETMGGKQFKTILADPPWRFQNKTGKVAPEHRRLSRYATMTLEEICALPVAMLSPPTSHLYLWCPNALLPDGLAVMAAWGFTYKANIVWHKVRKDGGSDGRGVGFYFRNVTELILFGTRGKNARTLAPGRRQVNLLATRKREHSRKPDEQYPLIETCSPGPYLELFGRGIRPGWSAWGDEADESYEPGWKTYAHNSASERAKLFIVA
jgi:N6-adenosine-specific RNA methylase IME4